MTIEDQKDPMKNDLPAVWDLVIQDIKERDQVGVARYGTRLQPFNGRDALIDAYQEVLDQAVYLRQKIYEIEHPAWTPCTEENVSEIPMGSYVWLYLKSDITHLAYYTISGRFYYAISGTLVPDNQLVSFLLIEEPRSPNAEE